MVFALVAPCILRQIRVIPNFCDDRDKTSSRMRIMKGDATVIEYLNRGLRHELAAINQYWLHYRLGADHTSPPACKCIRFAKMTLKSHSALALRT